MNVLRPMFLLVLGAAACHLARLHAAEPATRREALLDVAAGQVPSDTASDGATRFALEERTELGGKALKAIFARGDSVGDRVARIKDWRSYRELQFDVLNPTQAPTRLTLNVLHAGSKGYPTRVVTPIDLPVGVTRVRLSVAELKNTDGSAPQLGAVAKWYLAAEAEQAPTLFLGNVWLAGGAEPERKAGKSYANPDRAARLAGQTVPAVTRPTPFNTADADAVLAALPVFPADNPWNLDVSTWPVQADSSRVVASIGEQKPLRCNYDMAFILIPPDQKKVEVKITDYPQESDAGPFPLPDETPIEGWPVGYQDTPDLSLADVQRNKLNTPGDRHAIVIDPAGRKLYEFFIARRTDAGWQAAQASVFDLGSNRLRPEGWTSGDAAGLPIFPAVVRYDELARGVIDHALRVTVPRSRKAYVYPATHHAGHGNDPALPRMGERLRLKADFDTSGFSREAQIILAALKKHGMLVADNGLAWSISIAPDPRIKNLHEELRRVKGSAFEVITPPADYQPPR